MATPLSLDFSLTSAVIFVITGGVTPEKVPLPLIRPRCLCIERGLVFRL